MGEFRMSRVAMLRRSRAMVRSKRLWGTRLVFWTGALAIGVISVAFALAADYVQEIFAKLVGAGAHGGEAAPWRRFLPLLITPLGFLISAWAAMRFFPGTQGSGIPQAIASRHLRDLPNRGGLLTMRIVVGKLLLTIWGLLCGASIGREGPTVQIGAAIMLEAGRVGHMAKGRGLILAGSAAGIAAAFNTPLAGIVFAIEEMSRAYQARTNGVVLSTVIIAGVASLSILGSYTYFGVSQAAAEFPRDWMLVAACGLIGGAMGAGFSHATIAITRRVRRIRAASARPQRVMLGLALGAGVITAIVGVATDGQTYGTGYEHARAAVEGSAPSLYYFLAKLAATLAATVSGIPGGLFAPSLSVGAGLGSTIAELSQSDVALAAVLGMAGYFAGVTQAPMTAFVIILEMTGNHVNIVPIMAAAMLGYGTSRFISPVPLYHALSRLFIADALRAARANHAAQNAAAEVERAGDAQDEGAGMPTSSR